MKNKLIALDFSEYDTIEAAEMLLKMATEGKIVGLVFSAQLSRQSRKRKVLMGATGRAANDAIVATGLSAVLHCNLTQQAMSEVHD